MKKLVGLLLAGILAFTAATPTQASFDYPVDPLSEGDAAISYIEITDTLINQISVLIRNDREETERATLSTDDLDLLERLVHAEARGQEYDGKVAVAEVVLNRVDSSEFPDNVYDVITQKRQFEPYATGTIKNSPDEDAIAAVQESLDGTNLVEGALYFWNPTTATSRWLEKMTVVTEIEDHEFLE